MAFLEIAGWLGTLFTFGAYSMRNMLPLRCVALAANLAFIVYGALLPAYPVLVLHVALLPLNLFRLYEIWRSMKRMNAVRNGDRPLDVLTPFLKPLAFKKGDVIFRRGDSPDCVYLLEKGSVHLPELDETLTGQTLFGEMAYFTNTAARTTSAICDEDSVIATIDGKAFVGLYRQHPEFGHYIITLIASRLIAGSAARPEIYQGFVEAAKS